YTASQGFANEFRGERVPLLSEVLELIDNRIGVNIEIKEPPRSKRHDIVQECLRIIRARHAGPVIMLSSFHHPYGRRAKLLEPRITTGVLQHAVRYLHKKPAAIALRAGASFFLCSKSTLRRRFVEEAPRQGIPLEVEQAWLALQETRERIDLAELTVRQADENYRLAEGRYATGVGNPIEVTDALVALGTAKTTHTQALYDYKVAQAGMEKAMGVK
ncbi:MAG: TolC family protein, partial [Syntrophales bacterium LBB04]|nr:TolC family protein [Syntrophales bacterium LBB04]